MRINKVIFIKNALILTVTGLIIRFIGMLFRIWLAGAIGSEGIGLYSQVFSFYMLASAFASAGINTAVTRMVSEELALGNGEGARRVLGRCVLVALLIALGSSCLVFFGADFISEKIIGDIRAADALKTLTLSLPFMGVSSCLKGYFIARKKTAPASSSQIFEQFVRIGIIMLILGEVENGDITRSCRAVLFGDAIAEACSFIYMYISYAIDKSRYIVSLGGHRPQYSVFSRLRHIALPITAGRYLNSILRTAENVLVPKQLERFGMASSDALSVFGTIKGMALPLIFFPASFLNALSTLLIPEMSEAAASNKAYKVKYTAEKCIHITLISSLPIAVIFFFTGADLGELVYGDAHSGQIIRLLSPLVPLMYLDSVCDGLLKGLDQQFTVFRNSMLDSLGRLALILVFLPKFGFIGFIGIMYISNLFTCLMNLFRLKKISGANIKWFSWGVLPGVTATTFGTIICLLALNFGLSGIWFILGVSIPTALCYLFAVFKLNCISTEDIR